MLHLKKRSPIGVVSVRVAELPRPGALVRWRSDVDAGVLAGVLIAVCS